MTTTPVCKGCQRVAAQYHDLLQHVRKLETEVISEIGAAAFERKFGPRRALNLREQGYRLSTGKYP
jgi:hypothetical protein